MINIRKTEKLDMVKMDKKNIILIKNRKIFKLQKKKTLLYIKAIFNNHNLLKIIFKLAINQKTQIKIKYPKVNKNNRII